MKRTPLKRSTKPIKKSRSKPRPGRLKGSDLESLRVECFLRDKGICQHCGKGTVFDLDQECPDSYHMAHIKAKRIGLDVLSNVRTLCGDCHRKEHLWGKSMQKPVPKKVDRD